MDYFVRGVQAYLLFLRFVATLTVAWGVDRFVLGHGAVGREWPLLVGIAAAVALAIAGIRSALATEEPPSDHPW